MDSILDGSAAMADFTKDEIFGFEVPTSLPDVDHHLLNPRNAWEDKDKYDETAKKLAGMFVKNFEQFSGMGSTDYSKYGPTL